MYNEQEIEIENEIGEIEIEMEKEYNVGGTNDYEKLINQPMINGNVLIGDKTLEELGYVPYDDSEIKSDIGQLQVNVSNLSDEVNDHELDIENLMTNKANQSYVELVENEVKGLEESISEIDKDIANLQNDVESLETDKADKTEIPTKVSQLTNDSGFINTIPSEYITETELIGKNYATKSEIPDVSEFIKKNVDDLVNYYKKSETYTQTEINQLIGAIKTIQMKIVEKRPIVGESNIIYLVPNSKTATENIYDEYVYIDNKWELIGSTQVDLSDYYTIEEINTLLNDYVTSNNLQEILRDYATINDLNNKQDILSKTDKDDLVKESLINNGNTLTDEEQLKIESWLGLADTYLTMTNETPYVVSGNYNPANKLYVDNKIQEVEMAKFPNVTIMGSPTINNGQVSNFSMQDFLEFPFLVDFKDRPFEINFAITTGSNVNVQQNILDSDFGLAFAVRSGKFVIAISSNGTSWNIGEGVGTYNVQSNTSYRIKITWNRLVYKVLYSIDGGQTYIEDISKVAAQRPYPKQMYIGIGKLADNYFEGIINLNYANVLIDNTLIWQGMDDVGLATRLATDLSNIDEAGIQRIKDITSSVITNALESDY